MKFSVCVPVYNVEKYINKCLESLYNQTFHDFEIIIVNDGSTDSSSIIVDEYSYNHNNVKVIHKKNEGLISARRTAIREAKGDYIMFLDSDDYYENNCLEVVSKHIDKTNSDLVIFAYNYIDSIYRSEIIHELSNINNNNKIFFQYFLAGKLNYIWSKAIKRSIVDTDNSYKEYYSFDMGEDIIQSTYFFTHAKYISYIDIPLYNYRLLSGMTTKYHKDIFNHSIIIVDYVKDIFKNCNLITPYELEYYSSIGILQFAYSAYTNIGYSKSIDINELKRLIDNQYFRKSYKTYSKNYFNNILSKKQIIVLYLMYHKLLPFLVLFLQYKKVFNK